MYRRFLGIWVIGIATTVVCGGLNFLPAQAQHIKDKDEISIGIIGLDTSHAVAFTQLLNSDSPPEAIRGCRVVAAYPHGSRDIKSSTNRIPGYTKQVKGLGVEVVDSIEELLEKVDAVMLETNDGRLHFEQALLVLKAGKPMFIDKPMAASLADVLAIFAAAEHYKVPVFSASSLRFGKNTQQARGGIVGKILGCDTVSPAKLESTHPDLFWYGIHGVESLFTVMGPGCEKVSRASTPEQDIVVGQWKEGRLGSFRGMRVGRDVYGGTAYGEKGTISVGENSGYEPLILEIVKFFRTGVAPVSPEETIEIMAFMQAAEESKHNGGAVVTMASVLEKARKEAAAKQTW